MAGRIDARLNELGIELPAPVAPKAAKILHYKRFAPCPLASSIR